jgi:hypothetical protein
MARPRIRRLRRALGPAALVSLAGALLAACAPPAPGGGNAPAALYVANGLDGTVSRLDAHTGRGLGPPLPGGPAPARLAPGPDGTLLVLRADPPASLTHVSPAGGRWVARAVPLEPGASGALLAGDGGAQAVLAYHVPSPAGGETAACRLAVLHVRTGEVERTHTLPPASCAARDSVRSLALARGAAGPTPTAYLGIWRWPGDESGANGTGRGQIVALRTDSGAVVGVVPLTGAPEHLLATDGVRGAAPAGPRLLGVEEVPGPQRSARSPESAPPERRHLVVVDPQAGQVEAVHPLSAPARALAVSPDGRHAYLLAALDGPRGVLTHIDLVTETTRRLAAVSGLSLDVAVTDDRIYLPRADRDALLVLDRQRGRVMETIPVGRRPIGVVLGSG